MKFKLIPAGNFMMGSSEVYKTFGKAEFPQHQVEISKSFFLQTHEVTQSQWKSVMGTEPWKGKKEIKPNCPKCPAVYIDYQDIQEFIKKLNQIEKTDRYRLPTEAEWEYACRAGTDTFYSFGDDLKNLDEYTWYEANTNERGEKYAHPVGSKKPNAWGLYDMHGNVWELCSDWFDENYYQHSPSRDPKGPQKNKYGRTIRGGSYYFMPMALSSAIRIPAGDMKRRSDAGFRLVAETKP
jgi:formylglycine-generating enzyme required for sulfatase activity